MKFKGFATKLAVAVVLAVALIICFFVFFSEIAGAVFYIVKLLAPFLFAFLISLAANPLAGWLQKKLKLPRGLTAILVIILIVGIAGGIIVGVVWKLVSELKSIYLQFPQISQNIIETFRRMSENLSRVYFALPKDFQSALDSVASNFETSISGLINDNYKPVMMGAGNVAKALPSIFVGIIIFILSLYFMISNDKPVKSIINKIIPSRVLNSMRDVGKQIRKYLGGYVKAQLIIMSISFVIVFAGLSILRVQYAMLIALGVALFDALPFFGSGAVLIPWSIISFITSDIKMGIGLLIIYLSVIFTRQMIEPKIVSSNIGINPILTLMSMYIGYRVFSIGGMILGPVILMFIVSFYKAGAFDGAILFVKKLFAFIKSEIVDLYNYLSMK